MSVRAFACRDADHVRHIVLPDRPRRRDFLKVLFGRLDPTMTHIQRQELPYEEPVVMELSGWERQQRARLMQSYPLGDDATKHPEDITVGSLRAVANMPDPLKAHADEPSYRPARVKVSASEAFVALAAAVKELDKTVKENAHA